MKKLTNPRQIAILKIITEDIENTGDFTPLTNQEIYEKMDFKISPFSIRDHIIKMANNGFIQKINNTWINDVYYPRVIYKGKNELAR